NPLFIVDGTERGAGDRRASCSGPGRVRWRGRCFPTAVASSMVGGRPVSTPVTSAQLSLSAGFSALRHVPSHHQTGTALDLARMQPFWTAFSVARRDRPFQRLAPAEPGSFQRSEPAVVLLY